MPPERELLGLPVTAQAASIRTINEGRSSVADEDREQTLKRQPTTYEETEQELNRQRIADQEREQNLHRQRIADQKSEHEELNRQVAADLERKKEFLRQRQTEELKRRFYQSLGLFVGSIILGAGFYFYEYIINPKFKLSALIFVSVTMMAAVIRLSFEFLTKERQKTRAPDTLPIVEQKLSSSIDRLQRQYDRLAAQQNLYLTDRQPLTAEEHTELVKNIQKQVVEDSIKDLVEQSAREKIDQSKQHLIFLRQKHDQAMDRLTKEISDLNTKGIYNLIIGVVTTLGALSLLAYVALTAKDVMSDVKSVLFHYLPRLSIVVFAEVFAFFFLKNYRNNLDGIRYFHNEITNIESRSMAVEVACYIGDKAMLNGVIDSLAKTERNFRLQKDETTPDIEQSKIEANGIREILGSLAAILQKGKGS